VVTSPQKGVGGGPKIKTHPLWYRKVAWVVQSIGNPIFEVRYSMGIKEASNALGMIPTNKGLIYLTHFHGY